MNAKRPYQSATAELVELGAGDILTDSGEPKDPAGEVWTPFY